MKGMKTMKDMKGLARDADVAARLRRARSVVDSNSTRPFQVPVRSCRLLSTTGRWAAAGGRHVSVACQPPFMRSTVFMTFMSLPNAD
jgi:hypothetical protein